MDALTHHPYTPLSLAFSERRNRFFHWGVRGRGFFVGCLTTRGDLIVFDRHLLATAAAPAPAASSFKNIFRTRLITGPDYVGNWVCFCRIAGRASVHKRWCSVSLLRFAASSPTWWEMRRVYGRNNEKFRWLCCDLFVGPGGLLQRCNRRVRGVAGGMVGSKKVEQPTRSPNHFFRAAIGFHSPHRSLFLW